MSDTPIDIAHVERLLGTLYRQDRALDASDPPHFVEELALALEGAPGAARDRALAAASPELAQAFRFLEAEPRIDAVQALRARPPRIRRAFAASAGLAASAALAFLALHAQPSLVERGDRLTPKGTADAFSVGIARSASRAFIAEGEKVETGERLGFFYSATAPGYLTLVDREEGGATSVLLPPKAIVAGDKVPISDGAIVEPAPGPCEWLIAVFSDQPLDAEAIREAFAGTAAESEHCRLTRPRLPGARSVVVFPVRR